MAALMNARKLERRDVVGSQTSCGREEEGEQTGWNKSCEIKIQVILRNSYWSLLEIFLQMLSRN